MLSKPKNQGENYTSITQKKFNQSTCKKKQNENQIQKKGNQDKEYKSRSTCKKTENHKISLTLFSIYLKI